MKESYQLLENANAEEAQFFVELDFQARQHSRNRSVTRCGQTVTWFLHRGRGLEDGDVMHGTNSGLVCIADAGEPVTEVRKADRLLFTQAADHLWRR